MQMSQDPYSKRGETRSANRSNANSVEPYSTSRIPRGLLNLQCVAKAQFYNIFLYGIKMKIYNKGKIKEMDVYLDNQRDKFLWFSTKTKAFLIDLFFTSICLSEEAELANQSNKNLYFVVKQFEEEVVLMFDTEEEKKKYFNLFSVYIEELRRDDPKYSSYFSYMTKTFALDSIKNGKNFQSESDVLSISANLGLNNKAENKEVLDNLIRKHNVAKKKEIPFQCVMEYFQIMFCSRKMKPVFERYSKETLGEIKNDPSAILNPIMNIEEFKEFLRVEQKMTAPKIEEVTREFEDNLSFFDFCLFLYDEEYSCISQPPEEDENYPLTDYFCFSSHNTYLSGNQLTSDCKVSRYSDDLELGIKCVELDVHNDDSTPIVTHAIKGKGLCKPILFEDVIKEIDRFSEQIKLENNFHYPIILSIENHASDKNKEKMLNILTKYFSDTLFYMDGSETSFPTLAYLKGKILVKTSSKIEELKTFKKNTSESYKASGPENKGGMNIFAPIESLLGNGQHFDNKKLQEKYENFQKFRTKCVISKAKFDGRMATLEQLFIPISSMAKVTTIFKSPTGIKNDNSSPFECTSLTNEKVLKTSQKVLADYTRRSWLRTYPIGTEMNSGNYDPAAMLEVGAQIIALNTQTKDYYAWMMYGYFCGGRHLSPGLRGYALKPKHLREGQVGEKKRYRLKIEVIESSNFEVRMKFLGLAEDTLRNEHSKDEFSFSSLDESFIIFNIGTEHRDCVALRYLAEGYRILSGKNKNNYMDCGIRILTHVTLRQQ